MYLSIQTITKINNLNSPYIFDRKERLTTHCILNAVISECLKNQSSETVLTIQPQIFNIQLKRGEKTCRYLGGEYSHRQYGSTRNWISEFENKGATVSGDE